MSATDTHLEPRAAWIPTALQAVTAAGNRLAAAKRTRSAALVMCAQHELQNAVDAARDLDIEWGPIGLALGIARGNAYQRFRKKPSRNSMRGSGGGYRFPAL